jgi:hypothetical protein
LLVPAPLPAPLHPLDAVDRPIIEALLRVEQPGDEDIVHAARLWTRHRGSLVSPDLQGMLEEAFRKWGLTQEEIYERSLEVWSRPGWRPSACGQESSSTVGSGADVES